MSGALTNLLAFIVAISVLVAVHEYGHYLVGRLCGMKVLRFSIGFGKPIWTWIAGADRTEYCISAIPLGGYVKFLDEREGPVDEADQGRAFNHRPVPARIAVLLAGPFFNFLFAALAYWVLFISGVPTIKPAVGQVTDGSYAADAGLEFGDRILAVGDRSASDWEAVLVAMLDQLVSDGRVELELEAEDGWIRTAVIDVGGDRTRLTEPGMLFDGLGFTPWQPPAVVGSVEGAAAAGGILALRRSTAKPSQASRICNVSCRRGPARPCASSWFVTVRPSPSSSRSGHANRTASAGGSSASVSTARMGITCMCASSGRSRRSGKHCSARGPRPVSL